MTTLCPVCHESLDVCYYGGDCGEIDLIARERRREMLADIDISDMDECMECRGPCEPRDALCYSCMHDTADYEDHDR